MSALRFWGERFSRTNTYVIFTKKTQKELPPLFGASFKRESQFFSTAACAFNIFVPAIRRGLWQIRLFGGLCYPSLFLNFQDDLPGCSLRSFTTSKVGDLNIDRQMDIVNTGLNAPYYL
jgi:hypothetical protein